MQCTVCYILHTQFQRINVRCLFFPYLLDCLTALSYVICCFFSLAHQTGDSIAVFCIEAKTNEQTKQNKRTNDAINVQNTNNGNVKITVGCLVFVLFIGFYSLIHIIIFQLDALQLSIYLSHASHSNLSIAICWHLINHRSFNHK